MRRMWIALAFVVACGKNNEPPPPSSGSPNAQPESAPINKKDPVAAAHQLFGQLCATCHGQDGTGNGPAAANLNPKPRNYTDPAWQASVTDEDIKKTILLGGQATGKSPMMPGNPQLRDEPAELDELVKIVRGFKKQ